MTDADRSEPPTPIVSFEKPEGDTHTLYRRDRPRFPVIRREGGFGSRCAPPMCGGSLPIRA